MKILLVDDDRDMVDVLSYLFHRDGHRAIQAYDGEMALQLTHSESPDVVILDLMIPKRNGMNVLTELRKQSQVPVLVLSAIGEEERVVQALKAGADDYVIKPFSPGTLRARVESIARRSGKGAIPGRAPTRSLTTGEIVLNPARHTLTVDGNPVHLTHHEFALLHYLMLNHDVVKSVSEILATVWGYDSEYGESTLKVTVSRLRRKIEPNPSQPRFVITVYGEGYLFQS